MSSNKAINEVINEELLKDIKSKATTPNDQKANEPKELSKTDVWNQIVKLQAELVNLKAVLWNHQIINDSNAVGEDGEIYETLDTNVARMKITSLNTIFEQREKTLNSLLDFYKVIYNDLYQKEKNAAKEKLAAIQSVYDHYLAMFSEIKFEDEAEKIDIVKSIKKELDILVDDIKNNRI